MPRSCATDSVGESPVSQRSLVDRVHLCSIKVGGLQHALEVGHDFAGRTARHAVDHQRKGRSAFLCPTKKVPRNGVGVSDGRRDEDPQVGRGEQLCRQFAIRALDRVDVRGIDQREPGGHRIDRLHVEHLPGSGCVAGHAGQLGQQVGGDEPAFVRRMTDQHRRPSGGPKDPGGGHVGSGERVGDGGLARARGTTEDRQQGCIEAPQAGHEVVGDLILELGPHWLGRVGVGEAKTEGWAGEGRGQLGERRNERFGRPVLDRDRRWRKGVRLVECFRGVRSGFRWVEWFRGKVGRHRLRVEGDRAVA